MSFATLVLASAAHFHVPTFAILMQKGGMVMWPLLFCSILGLAVVVERLAVFLAFAIGERRARHKIETIYDALICGDVDAAVVLGLRAGPVGRFLGMPLYAGAVMLGGVSFLTVALGLSQNVALLVILELCLYFG